MSDNPLSHDELEHVRDGNAGCGPCHDCGVYPVYRPEDDMHHYFHREGCSVPEHIRQLVDEG